VREPPDVPEETLLAARGVSRRAFCEIQRREYRSCNAGGDRDCRNKHDRAPHRYSPIAFSSTRLPPPAVELGVEDLLPRPEVELAVGDREHDLVGHQLALQVRVGIVLADVVAIAGHRLVRCKALEPVVDVGDQPALVVVHIDSGR